ncbi:hypothetical protein UY3_12675 [Chelonia mydas]|uniref:Uncharacterized protein n=1 Tax=Chelonia mydas TaxID=8469 RepID=M7AXG5_CHEMY|nr:hypothetical protein UY3_12675 [Chelonia mydas]
MIRRSGDLSKMRDEQMKSILGGEEGCHNRIGTMAGTRTDKDTDQEHHGLDNKDQEHTWEQVGGPLILNATGVLTPTSIMRTACQSSTVEYTEGPTLEEIKVTYFP